MKEVGKKTFSVYVHWIEIDGVIKRYFGITSQKVERRWARGSAYKLKNKSGLPRHFYNAIQLYGWDNFTHEVLFENLTKEQASCKEKELIAKYHTQDERYGFNCQEGGFEGNFPNEAIKKKISENHADVSGINNPSCRGAIIQLDLEGNFLHEYNCVKEAIEQTGITKSQFYHVLAHHTRSCKGYLWYWKNEYNKMDKSQIFYKTNGKRPVKQLDDERNVINIFASCREAVMTINGTKEVDKIIRAIQNGKKAYGYYWEYDRDLYNFYDEIKLYQETRLEEGLVNKEKKHLSKNYKQVIDCDNSN